MFFGIEHLAVVGGDAGEALAVHYSDSPRHRTGKRLAREIRLPGSPLYKQKQALKGHSFSCAITTAQQTRLQPPRDGFASIPIHPCHPERAAEGSAVAFSRQKTAPQRSPPLSSRTSPTPVIPNAQRRDLRVAFLAAERTRNKPSPSTKNRKEPKTEKNRRLEGAQLQLCRNNSTTDPASAAEGWFCLNPSPNPVIPNAQRRDLRLLRRRANQKQTQPLNQKQKRTVNRKERTAP